MIAAPSVGRGAPLWVVGARPAVEQGLRSPAGQRGSVDLSGADPTDAPAAPTHMTTLFTHPLSYLAEELKYENERQEQEDDGLPGLRWRCVELAQSMAQSGFGDKPAVALWLEVAQGDPLPEVRHTVTSSAVSGD